MIERRWERVTGIAGIASVVLVVAALFTWGNQFYTDPLSKTMDHYVKHQNVALLSQFLFLSWGMVMLIFAAGLRPILGRAEGEPHILSTLTLGAGLWNAIWMMVWASVNGALVAIAGLSSPGEIRLVLAIVSYVDMLNFLAPGLFVGAAALAMLRGHVFGRWVAWLGVLSGAFSLVSGISFLDPNPNGAVAGMGNLSMLGLLLFLIWTIVVGVTLLRSPVPSRADVVPVHGKRVTV